MKLAWSRLGDLIYNVLPVREEKEDGLRVVK